MKAYSNLSNVYDNFTVDVNYDEFISFYEQIFKRNNEKPNLILDLACGTGTISIKMAQKGYDMIGIDGSYEMLMEAREKCFDYDFKKPPMFLCQKMNEIDLYGTVDACISSLDSINYITDLDELYQTFSKVDNFLNPQGLFIFDINTKKKLENLHEKSFVCEDEHSFLTWQCENKGDINTYSFDIFFENDDGSYSRETEEHKQRLYKLQYIVEMLEKTGFYDIKCYKECSFIDATEEDGRVFFVCKSKGDKKCKIK